MSNDAGSGFEARFWVSSGLRFRMISSALAFEMNVMPPGFTRGSDSRRTRSWSVCFAVALSAMKTCTASSRFFSSDHDTSQVPSPMKTPMRNIPMRTESADATVVETFAPIERSASAKSVRMRVILRRIPPRRSSRTSLPISSAMTRLRILSTISRSCVTIRIVVPVRLMR